MVLRGLAAPCAVALARPSHSTGERLSGTVSRENVMADLKAFKGRADLWFVRHGESEGNRAGVMQGRTPSRLTEAGRQQARAAGEWFRGKGIDLVLTSPLTRAAETASLLAETAGAPVPEPLEDLAEIGTGIFSGLTLGEAESRYPADWREFQRWSWEAVPEAERIEELLKRADRVWSALVSRAEKGHARILCVTHSGFMQWIIRSTLGSRAWMPLLGGSSNCCVSHLRISNAADGGLNSGHMATWQMINAAILPPSS
jgi:broad specificity phosphatase PhoE